MTIDRNQLTKGEQVAVNFEHLRNLLRGWEILTDVETEETIVACDQVSKYENHTAYAYNGDPQPVNGKQLIGFHSRSGHLNILIRIPTRCISCK